MSVADIVLEKEDPDIVSWLARVYENDSTVGIREKIKDVDPDIIDVACFVDDDKAVFQVFFKTTPIDYGASKEDLDVWGKDFLSKAQSIAEDLAATITEKTFSDLYGGSLTYLDES
ncbi:MAG: hypothetical protein D6712_05520 [Chloroflexi bacterium]|nr:MAG: hypothetical protein D6712_05520 [Chloroflexota bacterium]